MARIRRHLVLISFGAEGSSTNRSQSLRELYWSSAALLPAQGGLLLEECMYQAALFMQKNT